MAMLAFATVTTPETRSNRRPSFMARSSLSRPVVPDIAGSSVDRRRRVHERHRPEETLLYKLVAEHLETFLAESTHRPSGWSTTRRPWRLKEMVASTHPVSRHCSAPRKRCSIRRWLDAAATPAAAARLLAKLGLAPQPPPAAPRPPLGQLALPTVSTPPERWLMGSGC
jgi:hypothetical protein